VKGEDGHPITLEEEPNRFWKSHVTFSTFFGASARKSHAGTHSELEHIKQQYIFVQSYQDTDSSFQIYILDDLSYPIYKQDTRNKDRDYETPSIRGKKKAEG